jgi:5-methylcytosine-specific restriction endonuclease McrA
MPPKSSPAAAAKPKAKATIPKALREQVWRNHMGKEFEGKCCVTWCTNNITAFQFEVGHNIPESKGGATTADNLRPICSRCNSSMNNNYTIDEWNRLGKPAAVEPVYCCRCW